MYLSIYLSSSPLYLHINLKSISYLYTTYHLSPPINDLLSTFLISIVHLSVCIMYLPIYYLSIYKMSIHLTYTYHLYILDHLSSPIHPSSVIQYLLIHSLSTYHLLIHYLFTYHLFIICLLYIITICIYSSTGYTYVVVYNQCLKRNIFLTFVFIYT